MSIPLEVYQRIFGKDIIVVTPKRVEKVIEDKRRVKSLEEWHKEYSIKQRELEEEKYAC